MVNTATSQARDVVVSEEDCGMRLDQFAKKSFPEQLGSRRRSRITAKEGFLLVNGVACESGRVLLAGQTVTLLPLPIKERPVLPVAIQVVYEDDWMAVVEKPGGLLTNGNRFRTLENALPHNLTVSTHGDRLPRIRPVHRLDKATQGLVIVAKTQRAEIHLNRQFQDRKIQKQYVAVVSGALEGEGHIYVPVDGRHAETFWKSESVSRALRTHWVTTVKLKPITGRTHQLRRHMQRIGHPIMGDALYGYRDQIYRGKGLFLGAVGLTFEHPENGRPISLSIPEPSKFDSLRRREIRRWGKFFGKDAT